MDANSINTRVESIKGNTQEINKLIEEYKPFIASVVEKATGKFMRYGIDDELSIGLIAFEEAIRSFDISKGNFLAFAQNVIKRRLIDYFRKESKHGKVVPLFETNNDLDNDEEFDNSTYESIKIYTESEIAEFRRLEIEELKKELQGWQISYADVAKNSPKQEGTRSIYWEIIHTIINNKDILDTLKTKKYLPIAEIEKFSKVPRKKIERGRNYIIALVLILTGDYEYLRGFFSGR